MRHLPQRRRAALAVALLLGSLALAGCSQEAKKEPALGTPGAPTLSAADIDNIVRRSFQYIAMYNTNNKFALDKTNPMNSGGYNKIYKATELANADVKALARPNNDTLYQLAMLDLRDEPMILDVPSFDTQYASMETSAYDGYIGIPLATSEGDFKKPVKLLFYSARTKGFKTGDKIDGIDKYVEMTGDFAVAFLRLMPESSNPAKHAAIIKQIGLLKLEGLSEFQGKPALTPSAVNFPAFGATDEDVYGTNLLEVMQFVFNSTTFDPANELDQGVLAALKPLGVEPGKTYDASKVAKIDNAAFRQSCVALKAANVAIMQDPAKALALLLKAFLPKGKMDLDTLIFQNVIGPAGQPASQALYLPVHSSDGKPMNAQNDYVMKMTKDQLPPALAFWSLTLYDTDHGFFIPNKENKYSVGQNAGFKLNAEGGIEIHIAAVKPDGVPPENWLPINRGDIGISPMFRLYAPDLAKAKTWTEPTMEIVPAK